MASVSKPPSQSIAPTDVTTFPRILFTAYPYEDFLLPIYTSDKDLLLPIYLHIFTSVRETPSFLAPNTPPYRATRLFVLLLNTCCSPNMFCSLLMSLVGSWRPLSSASTALGVPLVVIRTLLFKTNLSPPGQKNSFCKSD